MDKFEEFGRKLDEELTRLRKFVEDDLAPETEKGTAVFLREVSDKLTKAAGLLETRRGVNASAEEKDPGASGVAPLNRVCKEFFRGPPCFLSLDDCLS